MEKGEMKCGDCSEAYKVGQEHEEAKLGQHKFSCPEIFPLASSDYSVFPEISHLKLPSLTMFQETH